MDNVAWEEKVSLSVAVMMAGMELIVHWHLRKIARMEKITTKVGVSVFILPLILHQISSPSIRWIN